MHDKKINPGVTQCELDTRVHMAKISTRVDQLESMQEHLFGKIETFVDEMKVLVKEVSNAHKVNADTAYVSKDVFYQREASIKEEMETHLNRVTLKFDMKLNEVTNKHNDLKMKVVQISTGIFVVWLIIQFMV